MFIPQGTTGGRGNFNQTANVHQSPLSYLEKTASSLGKL